MNKFNSNLNLSIILMTNLFRIRNNILWLKLLVVSEIIAELIWFHYIYLNISIVVIAAHRPLVHSKKFYFWVTALGCHISEFWSYIATNSRMVSFEFSIMHQPGLQTQSILHIDFRTINFILPFMSILWRFDKH